jgi:hypothetical protein
VDRILKIFNPLDGQQFNYRDSPDILEIQNMISNLKNNNNTQDNSIARPRSMTVKEIMRRSLLRQRSNGSENESQEKVFPSMTNNL